MSIKLVKGTAVVRLMDGKKLGRLEHVFLDPHRREVVAVSLGTGGALPHRRAAQVIAIDDICAIGADAVMVTGAARDQFVSPEELVAEGLIDLDSIVGRPVLTEDGTLLGRVMAVRFERDHYRLTHIGVAADDRQPGTLIPACRIQQLGEDVLVVSETVVTRKPEPLVAVA